MCLKNRLELRQVVVGCMGDFSGFKPESIDLNHPKTTGLAPTTFKTVAVHPEARRYAIGMSGGTIAVQGYPNDPKHRVESKPRRKSPDDLAALTTTGRQLICAERNGTIRVWGAGDQDVLKCAHVASLNLSDGDRLCAAITPDGKYLAVGKRKSPTIWMCDLSVLDPRLEKLKCPGKHRQLTCLAFNAKRQPPGGGIPRGDRAGNRTPRLDLERGGRLQRVPRPRRGRGGIPLRRSARGRLQPGRQVPGCLFRGYRRLRDSRCFSQGLSSLPHPRLHRSVYITNVSRCFSQGLSSLPHPRWRPIGLCRVQPGQPAPGVYLGPASRGAALERLDPPACRHPEASRSGEGCDVRQGRTDARRGRPPVDPPLEPSPRR